MRRLLITLWVLTSFLNISAQDLKILPSFHIGDSACYKVEKMLSISYNTDQLDTIIQTKSFHIKVKAKNAKGYILKICVDTFKVEAIDSTRDWSFNTYNDIPRRLQLNTVNLLQVSSNGTLIGITNFKQLNRHYTKVINEIADTMAMKGKSTQEVEEFKKQYFERFTEQNIIDEMYSYFRTNYFYGRNIQLYKQEEVERKDYEESYKVQAKFIYKMPPTPKEGAIINMIADNDEKELHEIYEYRFHKNGWLKSMLSNRSQTYPYFSETKSEITCIFKNWK